LKFSNNFGHFGDFWKIWGGIGTSGAWGWRETGGVDKGDFQVCP